MKNVPNIRYRSIFKIMGWLLLLEGSLMAIPMLTSLCLGEKDWMAFLISMLATAAAGGTAAAVNRKESTRIFRREGFLLISTIWILYSLAGMLPFMMCAHPLSVSDAFFETMSGLTTTGASTISDVEAQSHGILLWRAIIQWIGGLGIVLSLIAILPALNDSGGISLFNAEITGITHDKLHPRIRQTAASLWGVYSILTAAMIPFLMLGGMSFFDSICQAMSTLSTGGFSTRNASIGAWGSTYIASVVSVFMLAGGMNFMLVYHAFRGHWREAAGNGVLKAYASIVVVATAIIALTLYGKGERGVDSLLVAPLFQAASSITSTGFSYHDFSPWGPLPLTIIILLMICGACAGSTTGGITTDRICALFKNLRNEIVLTLFPNHITRVEVSGKTIGERSMIRIMAFITVYLITVAVVASAMAAYGYDITDSFFASVSCMGNDGLSYGVTSQGFSGLPDPLKWLFSFEMLVGRLEIFTVLVLFYPTFWKR